MPIRSRDPLLRERLANSPLARKITKYAIGSLIALLTSIVVFAVMYVTLSGHTTLDSIVAFIAGAIPNWVLNLSLIHI